jgi:hypothetical protein
LALLLTLGGTLANAASVTVTVPGIADIWLAGQPNGTILNGGFPGSDVAPTNSPVLGSAGLNLASGSVLTISATGSTDYNGCPSSTPDGGAACGGGTFGANFGISGYSGPINALIGVFVTASTPGGTPPATLDFTTLASQSQTTVSPQLNQVFFIGDGRTGTGSGSAQQFVVPAGATRLFLASSDGIGANYNNFGSFSVTISDAPAVVFAATRDVPAVSPALLWLTGLLLAGAAAFTLKRRRDIGENS